MRIPLALIVSVFIYFFISSIGKDFFITGITLGITTFYIIGTRAKIDRRYKTSYKNNIPPTPILQKLKFSSIGFGIAAITALISYFQKPSSIESKLSIYEVVAKDGINLRRDSTIKKANIITTLKFKEKVELIEHGTNWSKVQYNGQIGWAFSIYLIETN